LRVRRRPRRGLPEAERLVRENGFAGPGALVGPGRPYSLGGRGQEAPRASGRARPDTLRIQFSESLPARRGIRARDRLVFFRALSGRRLTRSGEGAASIIRRGGTRRMRCRTKLLCLAAAIGLLAAGAPGRLTADAMPATKAYLDYNAALAKAGKLEDVL